MKKILLVILTICMAAPLLAADRYTFISHAPDSDSWWNTIKNSLKDAEKAFTVTVDYRNPANGDLAEMSRLIEQAVARNSDGIITTIADYDVLKGPIQKAVNKGIPVITVNSGTPEQSKSLGAIMHIGQPEYAAGFGAGDKAKRDAGVKTFLCVNHYATNPVSWERCRGFANAIGISDDDFRKYAVDSGTDPSTITGRVSAYLRKNPKTDAVLALGPTSAHPLIRLLKKMGLSDKTYFATFDLSGEIAAAIKSGEIAFGIDQQPYIQGFFAVAVMKKFNQYGVLPGNNINSGPGFVTKDNIALVEKYAGEYR